MARDMIQNRAGDVGMQVLCGPKVGRWLLEREFGKVFGNRQCSIEQGCQLRGHDREQKQQKKRRSFEGELEATG